MTLLDKIEEVKTGLHKLACLGAGESFGNSQGNVIAQSMLLKVPQCLTEEEYNRIWDEAYNESRGSNVFNDIPSFKHVLTKKLLASNALYVRDK